MGHGIPSQPRRRAASGEIVAKINGKHLQCNGTECPWMTTDTEQRTEDMKKLSRAALFCVAFMVFEVVGGIRAGSLAILTDAAHLLSDVASFAISLFAMWAGGWEANLRQSYGFFRLEILGAVVSIQIIWLITGIIVYEAFVRLVNEPVEIDGRLMFIIAVVGLLVNLVMMFLLGEGHSHGSSNEHSPGHDDGQSNRSGNSITKEHKHTKEHNHSQNNHDHDEDEDSHRQPLLAEGHSDSHHHGKEQSHDHRDNAEQSPESPAQGKDFHHHHEDDQGHDDLNLRHQDRGDKVHRESDGIPGMVSYIGNGMDQSAGTVFEGHKTECVQWNITQRSRSNDTIIMCICDQLESRSENDSSVRVTIDHGSNDGEQDGSSHRSSINVRGAYLHVLGDLIQSIGVMVGGAIIWYKPEWKIVDLFCTFFFSILVLGTTIKMIRDILEVLMESTPREVDAEALQRGLVTIEGVLEVHELHIWAITVGKVVLACHVTIKPDADSDDLLEKVIQYCDHKYKISHVTIQIERQTE